MGGFNAKIIKGDNGKNVGRLRGNVVKEEKFARTKLNHHKHVL